MTLRKTKFRSSHPDAFLRKGVLKICCKFTEHPCASVISVCNLIEITLRNGCSPVNLLHILYSGHLFQGIPLGGCF